MKVFVYGILMKAWDFSAEVHGELYLWPNGIAAAKFNGGPETVKGEIRDIDRKTLGRWDRIEGTPDLYKRIRVKTTSGISCWAYQYNRSFEGLSRVESGKWPGR